MADMYHKIEKIGEGTYGTVYKAQERKTGRVIALKKIRLDDENEGIPPTTIREVSILKTIKHSTIINLESVFYKENRMYLAMEFVEMDLRKYIDGLRQKRIKMESETIKYFTQQILTAIDYCHSRAILHRDLKPQNILVCSDGRLKLADFGLGRSVGVPMRTYTDNVITLWYRPPELLLGTKYYNEAVDVWSAAAIIAELVLLVPIFRGDSEVDQIYKIFKILGTPDKNHWPELIELPNFNADIPKIEPTDLNVLLKHEKAYVDLVSKMLIYDPEKRISAKKGLKHPYLKDLEPILE